MLGAIIGDIVGSRFEFNPTNDYNFELFGKGCSYTDDTICTIAVADAILHGREYGESLHDWCRKNPKPMGAYGGRFRHWILSDNPRPYGSFGNGSAMRVSPVGWWFGPDDYLADEAAKSAECTHNHPAGIAGAVAVAYAVSDCLRLRREMKDKDISREDILSRGLHRAILQYTPNSSDFRVNIEAHRNKFDETCPGTVPVALAIILNSKNFEDAIRQAVSLGADADTLGAIVGSIAEALWGIPGWMKRKAMAYLPREMQSVVKEFRLRLRDRRQEAVERKKHVKTLMLWKLGLGNMGMYLNGENPMPSKDRTATRDMFEIHPIEDSEKSVVTSNDLDYISHEMMDILRKGHIPQGMEDHWLMYFDPDDMTLHYARSWTGMEAFVVHLKDNLREILINKIEINRNLAEFGVNGDGAALALLRYLIVAETGGDAVAAWKMYLDEWEALNK